MVTIIVGTNRKNSNSAKIGKICLEICKQIQSDVNFVELSEINDFGVNADMYDPDNQSKEIAKIQDEYIIPSKKWILILPEYNGGIPGIFKLFMDIISVRNKDKSFSNKQVFMVGVAAGRAGNARGLDYMTNCLNYMGMNVFPNKLPISSINKVLNNDELDTSTYEVLETLLKDYLK